MASDESLPLVIDPANLAAMRAINESGLGDRMKRALARVAAGEPVQAAATAEDYASANALWRYAKRFSLVDLKTKGLIGVHREISRVAGELIVERLTTDPSSVSTPQLGVLQGISTDKCLASEKASIPDGASYLSALDKLGAIVMASGQGLELSLTVQPTGLGAIDVTPSAKVKTGR